MMQKRSKDARERARESKKSQVHLNIELRLLNHNFISRGSLFFLFFCIKHSQNTGAQARIIKQASQVSSI